jgi:signal transduction histidine kinase/DNA-binding response OmpR family regulator
MNIKLTEDLLRKIVDTLPVHIYWTDKDAKIMGTNLTLAINFGCKDVESCLGKDIYDFAKILGWNKKMADTIHQEDIEIIKTGVGKITENTLILADGLEHTYLSYKNPIVVNGEVTGLMGISFDITDRKRVEQFESEKKVTENTVKPAELLQKIIDILPAHIYWTDKDTKIIGANLTQAVNFGCKDVESCLGKDIYDFAKTLGWSKETADEINQEHLEIIKSGVGRVLENTVKLADNSEHTYLSHKEPIVINGETTGLVGISVDITDRKNAEEQLRIAKEQAEAASEAKSKFIQNMQHDLRTPAAGISQITKNLVETEKQPKRKKILKQVADASARLLDLINDVLEFDKISSGQIPIILTRFDVHDLVRSIVEIEAPTIQLKKLQLHLECAKDVPKLIVSDKTRMFRSFLNLVSNAVKFTPKGFVKLIMSVDKWVDDNQLILKITVADSGIGIPKDKVNQVYDRFVRCTPSNKGLYPGSGLGLSITKQFIEELNGKIELESKEGKGTTFTCLIPCELKNTNAIDDITPVKSAFSNIDFSELRNKKVLLAEDDKLAQSSAQNIFKEKLHMKFSLAETGKELMQIFKENTYDIIFTDVGLPDITGEELTKKIRKIDKKVPIIAITAHQDETMKKNCLAAGMNDFLTKPLDIDKAKDMLAIWLMQKSKALAKVGAKATTSTPIEQEITERPLIDWDLAKKIAHGDEKLMKLLMKTLMAKLPEYLDDLKKAYETKNYKSLFLVSHKLKGALCYTGITKLQNTLFQLELATEKLYKIKKKLVDNLFQKACTEIEEIQNFYKPEE